MLYQILGNGFTAGFTVTEGKVTEAAPILKWVLGKNLSFVSNYCKAKGWVLLEIPS